LRVRFSFWQGAQFPDIAGIETAELWKVVIGRNKPDPSRFEKFVARALISFLLLECSQYMEREVLA
jgi:hypothetical protein